MFKAFLILTTILIANSAIAGISFRVIGFQSGYVDGVGKIQIRPLEDGKMWVQWDKNSCAADGSGCTRRAYSGDEVTPTVGRDVRPADGPLTLELTPEIQLRVSSRYNSTGMIAYTAMVKTNDGMLVRVPLTANVDTVIEAEK